jgi:ubiquinone/menaquinone biosynthesis C-methylase UbiE
MLSKISSALSSLFGGDKSATSAAAVHVIPVVTAPVVAAAELNVVETSTDPLDAMVPDYSIASYVGGDKPEQFKAVGNEMIERFKTYADLKPNERVLEVGCGIGRIAIPLTQYLTAGSFVGFDIVQHGIEWCQQKVTPRYPHFTFFVADVHNKFYHPEGRHPAAEYTFPLADASFDFVYLTSVFTHMLPKDLERYVSEISRVLRPGGRCFCTAYIISQEARTQIDKGASHRIFTPQEGGYWTDSPTNPEAATAYPDDYFNSVFSGNSLAINQVVPGEWWANQFAQDFMVAVKA